jgi:hypothetical protein
MQAKKITTYTIDPDLAEFIAKAAAKDGRTASNLVNKILREWKDAQPKPRKK